MGDKRRVSPAEAPVHRARVVDASRRTAIVSLLVLLALAVPRLLRLFYPQIWIEDESYLNGAFLLARGWLPYRDFPLPHLPALEALLAAVFLVAPISIRTAEIVTQIAAYGGSVLVFLLGRRLGSAQGDDTLTGGAAAIIFATSALLFRYHVFEREVFLVVPLLGAALLAVDSGGAADSPEESARASKRTAIWIGILLAVAMAIKLTAVSGLAGLAAYLVLRGRRHEALVATTTAVAVIAALTIAGAAVFGVDFLAQVVVFRAVHASFPSLAVKLDEMRYSLDISLATGLAGAALVVWQRRVRDWLLPLTLLAAGFVFLVALNPTYWAHTGIELLPWLALLGGWLVAATIRSLARRQQHRAAAVACAIVAAALLVYVAPIRNLNWQAGDGAVYGFGYRDRAEIATMAAFVRAHAAPDALVAAPPIIAFAANRREVVPYAEVAGDVDEIANLIRTRGYLAALTDPSLRGRSFWDSVEASRDRMAPALADAVRSHRAAVVIDDSPDDLLPLPLVNLPPPALEAAGYDLSSVSTHYEAWIPRPAPAQAPR